MLRAVKAGDAAQGDEALERLAAIKAAVALGSSDTVELSQIGRLTGLSNSEGDSLHRLVMDLHKALNRLAAAHAEEVLAGAHVYGLLPDDRPAVEAFMRGRGVDLQAEIRIILGLRQSPRAQAPGSRSRTISEKPTRM